MIRNRRRIMGNRQIQLAKKQTSSGRKVPARRRTPVASTRSTKPIVPNKLDSQANARNALLRQANSQKKPAPSVRRSRPVMKNAQSKLAKTGRSRSRRQQLRPLRPR